MVRAPVTAATDAIHRSGWPFAGWQLQPAATRLSPVLHADTVRGMTRQFIHTFTFTFVFCLVSTFPLSAALTVRGRSPVAEKLVAAVIRADYQGDRAALARLEAELGAVPKAPATDPRQ